MTEPPDASQGTRAARYLKVIGWFFLILGVFGFIFIAVGSWRYSHSSFVDVRNGRICTWLEGALLPGLLFIPYFVQSLLLYHLYQRYKRDEKLWMLFRRYVRVMFFAMFSYALLWLCYTTIFSTPLENWLPKKSLWLWEFIALGAIVLLIYEIVRCTRIITRDLLKDPYDNLADQSVRSGVEDTFRRIFRRGAQQKNLEKQDDQKIKDNIVRFQFEALSFFFTVLLCIGFLFGFCFAFYDRYVISQTESTHKTPGLFMAKEYLSQTSCNSVPTPSPTPISFPTFVERSDQYTFYYDKGSGGLKTEGSNNGDDLTQRLRSDNQRHLNALAERIENKARDGVRVVIELIGRADDASVRLGPKQTYSSNFELSDARAQDLRRKLLQKLQPKLSESARVEWLLLPISNDPSREEQSLQGQLPTSTENTSDDTSRNKKDTRLDKIEQLKKSLSDTDAMNPLREDLKGYVVRLENLINDTTIPPPVFDTMLTKLSVASNFCKLGQNEEARKVCCLDLETIINNYEARADGGNQRVVEAYLTTITPAPIEPQTDTTSSIRLGLMEYMYFSLYTITTTGYGDIRPTTTYARFLCVLENIAGIFSIVLFFNALISVRGRNDKSQDA